MGMREMRQTHFWFVLVALGVSHALTPCPFGPGYNGSKYNAEDCPNFSNSTITAFGAQQACFADLFNGCGTDQLVATLPQPFLSKTNLGYGVNFTSCCDTHDNCYGTPGAVKSSCDTSLRDCIQNTQCTNIPSSDFLPKDECKLDAEAYYGLVRDFGSQAFSATQKDAAAYTAKCLAQHAVGRRRS